jgi:separase
VPAAILDPARFQRDYVDILPPNWAVVSLALNGNDAEEELVISRIEARRSPFTLRLPLARHSSRDAYSGGGGGDEYDDDDAALFGFRRARAELAGIIEAANASAHDARDMTRRGAKTQWWAAREALDAQLRALLANVESVWLGGFRGVLAPPPPPPAALLARFQQSFQNVLDAHLPSRAKAGKKKRRAGAGSTTATATTTSTSGGSSGCSSSSSSSCSTSGGGAASATASAPEHVMLAPHILGLFVSLGCPSDENDLDEPLLDLLYFVVDILQFHGEHNAYDEIDFDSVGFLFPLSPTSTLVSKKIKRKEKRRVAD